jgi:hypothetical protein
MKVKLTELATIRDQIETNAKLLEESNARLKKEQARWKIRENDLEQFNQVCQMLDVYEHPELSYEFGSLARAMIDFKNLNYNPKDIISKYENVLSLTSANQKLDASILRSEDALQSYIGKLKEEESRWGDYNEAFKIFTSLVKDGLKAEDIFQVVHVLKKDFPQNAVPQLIEDIARRTACWTRNIRRKISFESVLCLRDTQQFWNGLGPDYR